MVGRGRGGQSAELGPSFSCSSLPILFPQLFQSPTRRPAMTSAAAPSAFMGLGAYDGLLTALAPAARRLATWTNRGKTAVIVITTDIDKGQWEMPPVA